MSFCIPTPGPDRIETTSLQLSTMQLWLWITSKSLTRRFWVRALPHGIWLDAFYNRKSKGNGKEFHPKPVEYCHPDRSNCCTIMLAYHWAMKTAGTFRTWPLQDFAPQEPTWRRTEWTGWPSSGFAIWRRTKKRCYSSTGWQMISSNWKSGEQTLRDHRRPLA